MSRSLLITRGKPGGRVLWPGTLVDDALEPGITTALQAQGTRLGAADNATLIAAAAIAANLKLRGQPIEQAEQVMQAAADQVTNDALSAIPAGEQGEQGETGPAGPQGEPGAAGAGGTAVVGAVDVSIGLGPSGTNVIGLSSGSGAPTVIDSETMQDGMRAPQFVCGVGWPVACSFLVEGIGRAGAAQSEVVASPGLSGGTVKAVKSYVGGFTVTVQNPTGAASADLQLSQRVGVMNVPVVEFVGTFDLGAITTPAFVEIDKVNGWYDIGVITASPTHIARYTHRITTVAPA